MNNISTYIIEKLKINKDSKIELNPSDIDTIVSIISNICSIDIDTTHENLIKGIEDWVKENHISKMNEIRCYVNLYHLKNKFGIIYDYLKKNDLLKFIINPDKELDELIWHTINNKLCELVAVNSVSEKYGKLYVIKKTQALIFVKENKEIYYYFEVK